ncbi:MAG: bifunctional diguanylate cyclase/phosphodiesterase [Spirochaetales bacterium]|nr:bifunctional diguanylate cyclase/phosphodiesterase [Spirochaetales bacterium]
MRKKGPRLQLFILLYLTIFLPLIFILFFQLRSRVLTDIDQSLFFAALDMDRMLGPDFHDKWNRENPLSFREYDDLKRKLSHQARLSKISYLYTMVKEGDSVYFVVSSETLKDMERGTPSLFYNPYPDPPREVLDAFDSEEPVIYCSYSNIWDSFYSVFILRETEQGFRYILAADIQSDLVGQHLRNSLLVLVGMLSILLAAVIPFSVIFFSQSRKRNAAMTRQFYSDELTGLANRRKFLEDCLKFGSKKYISAVMFDVDSFREVNNLYGGHMGDKVLKHTVEHIKECIAPEDRLYKFPADEFVLIMRHREREEVIATVEKVIMTFDLKDFCIEGQPLNLTLRAGILHRPCQKRRILPSLDIAKAYAKRASNSYVFYDDSMNEEESYVRNFQQLNQLKDALDEGRILPYYQPIYSSREERICRYEALVRMMDREGNPLAPEQFLSVAKTSKLYKYITKKMIDCVFRDFSQIDLPVSINLSIMDLTDRGTMDHLFDALEKWEMAGRVTIEILESESLYQVENFSGILESLRSRGITIAIDDFGSGYSNFGYLATFPMDFLKIDGEVVRKIFQEPFSEAVIKAVAAFSHDLNTPLIAEYVESGEIMDRLIQMGLEYFQGYYIGKPCSFEELRQRDAKMIGKGRT